MLSTLHGAKAEKKKAKTAIEAWFADFRDQHGRAPYDEERDSDKDLLALYARYEGAKDAIAILKNPPIVQPATVLHQKTMDQKFKALVEEHGGDNRRRADEKNTDNVLPKLAEARSMTSTVGNAKVAVRKPVEDGAEPPTSQAALDYFKQEGTDIWVEPTPPATDIGDVILDMRRRLDYDMLEPLVEDFDEQVKPEVLNIASVPTSEIVQREREVELARLRDARAQAKAYHERELDLAWREQSARDRVLEMEEGVRRRAREEDKLLRNFREEHRQSVKRHFHHAKVHLENAVARQKGRISELYGQPILQGRAGARRYRVEWSAEPRPVEVRAHLLRAVRDKLPAGRYSLLLTMHDRLGGCPLAWSRKDSGATILGQRPSATRPQVHRGRYYDGELRIEQSMFALCPSDVKLHPSNVFIFELYRIGDSVDKKDTVVGWGVLPMCDGYFSVVKGCFKVPLLKGPVDRTIDLHRAFEDLYRQDLSRWLANIYVEVRYLPRKTLDAAGLPSSEYDIEYDFVNSLLNLGSEDVEARNLLLKYAASVDDGVDAKGNKTPEEEDVNGNLGWFSRRRSIFGYASAKSSEQGGRQGSKSTRGAKSKNGGSGAVAGEADKPAVQPKGDPLYHENELVRDEGYGSGDEHFLPPETLTHVVGVEATSAGLSGIRKRRRGDGARWDPGGLAMLQKREKLRSSQTNGEAGKWRILETESDLDEFSMSVAPSEARRASMPVHVLFHSKIRYFVQEIFADHEMRNMQTTEFWYTILAFILGLWFRMYVHYFGQWIYLKAYSTPLFDFRVFPHRVQYKYMVTSMSIYIEIGFVFMGPVSNILVLLILTLAGSVAIELAGRVQDWFSKFTLAFSIATVLDPFLVLLVDVIIQNYQCNQRRGCEEDILASSCRCTEGDAFKLWVRMESQDDSGVVGILIVAVIYFSVTIIATGFMYVYLKHVHMNGRMIDIFRRINSSADDMFIPHDYEMSERELLAICSYAKRWRGVGGEHRIVSHCDYEFVDPILMQSTTEKTTHLAIHTCNPADGSRSLWRQFIRSPDGAVLEVVSDNANAISSDIKGLEKLLQSGSADSRQGEATTGYFAGVI